MMPQQSPLFIPALWQGNGFKILDETLLPWKVEYLTAHDVSEAIQVVREMKTRAFGQVLTFFYSAVFVAREDGGNDLASLKLRLKQLADEFTRARPTFDFGGLGRLLESWLAEVPSGAHPGKWLENKIHEHVSKIPKTRMERARRAAELLPDSCRLLTHCNISGEVAAIAQCGKEMGKKIHVIATETRPYLQGSRLTAWEVAQAGIPVTLIPDCAIAQVMDKGEIDAVLVGADRVAQNGDVINKVGTYPLALTARKYGIPFYALVQNSGALSRGANAVIEERPVSELLTFQGRPLLPQAIGEIKGRYPAFDVTPADLISFLISFEGTFTPEIFREKHLHAPLLRDNGRNEREKFLLVYGIPKKSDYAYLSHALKAEKCRSLLIPEMRPELWGVHIVIPELAGRKLPITLISDNMMGTFFAQGQIQRLYLFYTGLSEKGPIGVCGSLLAVLLAHAHGIGIELFSSEEIKHTPLDRDVATFLGQRVCPEGVAIFPIEKETIPWSLFKEGVEKRS
jgi:methylthioribose-1-phosphate isomerase